MKFNYLLIINISKKLTTNYVQRVKKLEQNLITYDDDDDDNNNINQHIAKNS